MRYIFKYAPLSALLLIIVEISNALMIPLMTYFLMKTIDGIITVINTGVLNKSIYAWISLLIIVYIIYGLREILENIIKLNMKNKLKRHMGPMVAQKYMAIEYSCFENQETRQLLDRIGVDCQDGIVNYIWELLFIPQYIISITGMLILFMAAGWWVFIGMGILSLFTVIICIKDMSENRSVRIDISKREKKERLYFFTAHRKKFHQRAAVVRDIWPYNETME